MTTTLRPSSGSPAPASPDHVLPSAEARRAMLHDLVHSWALDLAPFAAVILEDLKGKTRPVMVELSCGTGELAMHVLRGSGPGTYAGFDDSAAAAHCFRGKVKTLPASVDVRLTAPIDLTRRASHVLVSQAPRADAVFLVRFLQTIPPMVVGPDQLSRTDFIRQAQQLARPGAKLWVVEDVFGETPDQHRAAQSAWDDVIQAAVQGRADLLARMLPSIDPEFTAALEHGDKAAIVRAVRGALDRGVERQPLPQSAWSFLFERLGLRYQTYRHPALSNVLLFAIEL